MKLLTRPLLFCVALLMLCTTLQAATEAKRTVYVDKKGTLRWSDTKDEATFWGVNYTLPFAHAYRAAVAAEIDHRQAIDDDVYHFSRLGFNAYRIHIWDVEISDAKGNLLENNHLDLLDYLIFKLQQQGIYTVVTTMTTFGNGYPERNSELDGFSAHYDKWTVRTDSAAIEAQKNYVVQLLNHKNPYTGASYKNSPSIVGFEINNEPSHSGTKEQVADYISSMVSVMRGTGLKKPIFYNASHNLDVVESYYDAPVDGLTYQWYPTGLVSGATRKGNFLPSVDKYTGIPRSESKGFNSKALIVYEFDPADNLYSHLFPAIARSFRGSGFNWVTQFAYDPTFMANVNTEYQTHYLNLVYTPAKALSMRIAAEAFRRTPRFVDYGTYPADTVFGDFEVSYHLDRSMMNSEDMFLYTASNDIEPKNGDKLTSVAGVGPSRVVEYDGTGVYMLDKLSDGVWRLEVMPDAYIVADPFATASSKREVATVKWNSRDIRVLLPNLGSEFSVTKIDGAEPQFVNVNKEKFKVTPGVYLLSSGTFDDLSWRGDTKWRGNRLGRFVAPKSNDKEFFVHHTPALQPNYEPMNIEIDFISDQKVDSAYFITGNTSLWSPRIDSVHLKQVGKYKYRAEVPAAMLWGSEANYNIVIYSGGKAKTYPSGVEGSPLDWDMAVVGRYHVELVDKGSKIVLVDALNKQQKVEHYTVPELWAGTRAEAVRNFPGEPTVKYSYTDREKPCQLFVRSYVGDMVKGAKSEVASKKYLCLNLGSDYPVNVALTSSMGITYRARVEGATKGGVVRVALSDLEQSHTVYAPAPYPEFLVREFSSSQKIDLDLTQVEFMEISTNKSLKSGFELGSVWLE